MRSKAPGPAVSDDAVKLTDVSEEISKLISEISERYGIGSPITARRLTRGYANDVFRLDADGMPTVLHLKHPPVDADSLNWEHRLLAQLTSHLPEVLAPVPARDRLREGGYVVSARLAAVAALRELSSAPTVQQLLVGIPAPAKGARLAATLSREGGR